MQTFLAGEDIAVQLPLRSNGEPIIPDTGSVKFTLRDNAGQVLLSKQPVTMGAASTEASYVVPAIHNALGSGRFSMRTAIVEFTKSGRPLSVKLSYRLAPWFNTTVDADDVRAFIGVEHGELPDDVIDITDAYLAVEREVGQAALIAALAGADQIQIRANELILAKAVLAQLPGLPLRLSQNESNGVFSAQRPKIDLALLELRALALYGDALGTVVPVNDTDRTEFLVVAISPDPFTGA